MTGRNLAYTYLEEVIEKNDDKIGLILMLIPVLACNDTKSTSRWDSLRTQFFENNKELILHQLGYTNLVEAFEKIPLDEKGNFTILIRSICFLCNKSIWQLYYAVRKPLLIVNSLTI